MDESGQDKFKKSTKSLSFLSINSNKLPHGHSCEHEHVHPSIHPSLSRSSSQIDFLNFAEPQNSNKLKKKSFNDLLSNCEVGCDIMMMEISENMQKSDSHVYDFQNNSNTEVQIVPKNYTESEIDLCDDTKRGLFAGNILEDRTKEKCAHYFMDDPLTFKNANSELMDHQFPTLCIECDWEDEGNVQNISNQWVVDISTEFIKNINSRHIEDSVVFQKLFELKQNMTSRENIYSCFKDCDKYLTDSAKIIKNSEMDGFGSSGTINDKNVHKNGVLRRFSSHSFDRDSETALFVNETIKNRIISEKVELEPTPKSVHGIGVSSSQVNIKIASMPKQDRLCKLQVRSKTKEDNSDAYSFEELKAMLNLRTVTFDEMPSNPVKIGEASFSEVYKIGDLIYKIIPFNQWYSIESFCKEAFILDVLKSEAGVCKLVDSLLIKGGYSQEYLRAWDSFANGDNPRPSQLNDDQLYGVLVMNDCGCDLEKYRFKNFTEVVDFIDQLLSAICSLEERFKFEHRDMHWGNIMIKNSMVYIIDFNFARLETDKIVYTDLNAQEWLFEGDRSVDMQFEIYVEARKACKSNWKAFSPKSNLLWVRYLLRKLELKLETFKEDVGSAKKIQNKRMLGKITQKAYEFADCKGFRKYFDMFISKNTSNLYPISKLE